MNIRSRIAVALFAAAGAIGVVAQGTPVDVVEYYHAGLDHYFVSALPAEVAALDSGTLKGWGRTGLTFKAHDAPAAGTSPVCRFYIPPGQGDSHFYSASPAECAEVAAKFPAFSYESPSVMHVGVPDAATGACPAGWTAVYRLWNNRADSNHRYTTDRSARADMIARGYLAEGYGPEGVAMCALGTDRSLRVESSAHSLYLLPGATSDIYVTVTPAPGDVGTVTLDVAGVPPGVAHTLLPPTLDVSAGARAAILRLAVASTAPASGSESAITVTGRNHAGDAAAATISLAVAPTGDPVATRLEALAAVAQRASELHAQKLPVAEFLQAIAAYMSTHPAYAKAGIDIATGSAWGWFRDGLPHIVAAGFDPGASPARRSAAPPAPRSGAELPFAAQARLLHPFQENFAGQAHMDDMRSYLRSRGWNVVATLEGDATVTRLMGTQGDGFFYINSHAGRIEVDDAAEPEGKIYAVWTASLVDRDLATTFKADIDALRLVPMTARNGRVTPYPTPLGEKEYWHTDTRYAFTYRFVRQYMSFVNESVAFINACFSSRNQPFIDAFHAKGAGVYLGWTDYVNGNGAAFTAPAYFVDRMVGANRYPAKETPPQRPFPYDLVLKDMAKKGLDVDKLTGGRLVASAKAGLPFPPIFAPSIRSVRVDEYAQTLTLAGDFGQERPKVTVDGVELGLNSWSATEIEATLPLKGAGSHGDVVVEVRGVKSNARQLTEWSIPLTYQWLDAADYRGVKLDGFGRVRYRADVAGYRLAPGEPLRYPLRGGPPTRDSALTVTAAGSYSESDCTVTVSGTGVYESPAGGVPATVLAAGFKVDGKTLDGGLGLAFGSAAGSSPHIATLSGKGCPNDSYPFAATFGFLNGISSLPTDQSDQPSLYDITAILYTLNSTYTMPAVNTKKTDFGGTIVVSWPAVGAMAAPRNTDDSGK